jgi:hypothetical protein
VKYTTASRNSDRLGDKISKVLMMGMRINHRHHCPRRFCRNERHRLGAEPPPRLQPSTPPKPVLLEAIMSGSDEAKARSRFLHAIAKAEPIEDPEAGEEHRPVEVPVRKVSTNGYMLVHDW